MLMIFTAALCLPWIGAQPLPMPRETVEPPVAALTFPLTIWDEVGPIRLIDAKMFGIAAKDAYDGWQFSEAHLRWIESRWWDTAGWEMDYFNWVREANTLAWAWYHLWRATDPESGEETKLTHLQRLRDRIGVKPYYCGISPPPAPYWRFSER